MYCTIISAPEGRILLNFLDKLESLKKKVIEILEKIF